MSTRFLVLTMFLFCMNAKAMDGNELLKAMENNDNFFQYGAMNYISGVSQSLAYYEPKVMCVTGVTNGQRYDSIKLYLQNNPRTRHLHAFHLIRAALSKDYGCLGGSNEKAYSNPLPSPTN